MKKRITIIGAGAVGLELAIRITAEEAADVTVVGKEGSDRLRAVQEDEVFVRAYRTDSIGDVSTTPGKIRAVSDVREIIEPQDYVFIAVKGQDITQEFVATTLQPLIDKNPKIAVVMAQNGVPVWMNHSVKGIEYRSFSSIDQDGEILHAIGAERIIGMVLNRVTNYMDRPGEVVNATPPPPEDQPRIIIGRPDGISSDNLDDLLGILNRAGMTTDVTNNIREPLFNKLMLNIGGCVTAITGQSLDVTFGDNDYATQVGTAAITEARRVIRQYYGIELPDADYFTGIMASLTGYEPSILKDLKDGKETETKPMLDTISDMARWRVGRTAPVIEALSSAIKELEQIATREGDVSRKRRNLQREWDADPSPAKTIIRASQNPSMVTGSYVSSSTIEKFKQIATRKRDISMKKQNIERKWSGDPSPEKTIISASENPGMGMQSYVPFSTTQVIDNSNDTNAHLYFLNLYLRTQGVDPSSMYQQPGTWVSSTSSSRQSISPPIEGKKWTNGIVKRTPSIPIPPSSEKKNGVDQTDTEEGVATSYDSTSSTGSESVGGCDIKAEWNGTHAVSVTQERNMIYLWFGNAQGTKEIEEIRNLRHAIMDSINTHQKFYSKERIVAHQRSHHLYFPEKFADDLKNWYRGEFSAELTISTETKKTGLGR